MVKNFEFISLEPADLINHILQKKAFMLKVKKSTSVDLPPLPAQLDAATSWAPQTKARFGGNERWLKQKDKRSNFTHSAQHLKYVQQKKRHPSPINYTFPAGKVQRNILKEKYCNEPLKNIFFQ